MGETEIIKALSDGANQKGVRDHNERLILSLLHRYGQLAAMEIARRTQLSAQTISVILRKLESDGLVRRGPPVKGKVGKPSVPVTINPDGALSIGIKLGRRGSDLFLTNLEGAVLFERRTQYEIALPAQVFRFVGEAIREAAQFIGLERTKKICGIGIALPFEIWKWSGQEGADQEQFRSWKGIDFQKEIGAFTDLPVFMINDATSACWAEHVYGRGKEFHDYAYFFISTFVGGGVVINQNVYEGSRGNAGALGSMPVTDCKGQTRQLLDVASIHVLEQRIADLGQDPKRLWQQPQDWSPFAELVTRWIDDIAPEIAQACQSTCAVIDFEAIVVDGAFPEGIRHQLVTKIRAELSKADNRGLILPAVEEGTIGGEARAIGAACGPIYAQYFLNSKARMIG
jgi:predicted NBD/HSP70 family sugar kinase